MQPNDQQPADGGSETTPMPTTNSVTEEQVNPTVGAIPAPEKTVQPPASSVVTPPVISHEMTAAPVVGSFMGPTPPAPNPVAAPADSGPLPTVRRRNPFSRLSKKVQLILAVCVAVVLLAGGSAGAYFGIVVPNKPENVWKSAMTNSGKAYDALSEYATKQRSAKGTKIEGSYSVKGAVVSDGKFSSKSLGADSQSTGNISAAGLQIGFDIRTLKSSGDTPDLYFKLTGLQGIGNLIGGESELGNKINGINNQWFVVDHTLFEQFGGSADMKYNNEDAANLLKSVGGPTKEYLFSTDKQKAVFEVKQLVGPEKKDGRNTYHYKVAYNSDNLGKYVNAVCETLKKDKLGKELFAKDPANCSDIAKEASSNKSNNTADVWVDKRTKLPHVVRISEKDNYVEFGQDYQGGKSYPFNMTFHSKEGEETVEATLKGSLDTKTDIIKMDGSLSTKGGSEKDTTGTLSLTISPSNDTSLKVEKPENAKSLIEFLNGLGLGGFLAGGSSTPTHSGSINAKSRDTKRITDMNNLYAKLEEFYNNNGYYPSTFTTTTLEGIDEESLRDPVGGDLIRMVSPVASVDAATAYPAPTSDTAGTAAYVYIPYPSGCRDNCDGYLLKTFIEQPSGSITNPYVKKSLNL